jgi:hypothetical protein
MRQWKLDYCCNILKFVPKGSAWEREDMRNGRKGHIERLENRRERLMCEFVYSDNVICHGRSGCHDHRWIAIGLGLVLGTETNKRADLGSRRPPYPKDRLVDKLSGVCNSPTLLAFGNIAFAPYAIVPSSSHRDPSGHQTTSAPS